MEDLEEVSKIQVEKIFLIRIISLELQMDYS